MNIPRVIILAVMGWGLTACSHDLQQLREAGFDIRDNLQTGNIEFKVQGNPSRLVIQNNANQRCDKLTGEKKFRRGCFNIDKGDQGLFTFRFKQHSDADDYYFSGFQLCTWEGGDTPPARQCELTVAERRDFSVDILDAILVPDSQGKVDLSKNGSVKPERFTLWTSNLKEQTYFYWVDVCPKDAPPGDPDCLTVDPGSRNGGVRH